MMPSILTDGKDALAVFDAVADISAGGHRGFFTAFRNRHAGPGKRRYRDRDTDGRKLISNGGASLIFLYKVRHIKTPENCIERKLSM